MKSLANDDLRLEVFGVETQYSFVFLHRVLQFRNPVYNNVKFHCVSASVSQSLT